MQRGDFLRALPSQFFFPDSSVVDSAYRSMLPSGLYATAVLLISTWSGKYRYVVSPITLSREYMYSRIGFLKPGLLGSLSISVMTLPSDPRTNSIRPLSGDTMSAASRGSGGTGFKSARPGSEDLPGETELYGAAAPGRAGSAPAD